MSKMMRKRSSKCSKQLDAHIKHHKTLLKLYGFRKVPGRGAVAPEKLEPAVAHTKTRL